MLPLEKEPTITTLEELLLKRTSEISIENGYCETCYDTIRKHEMLQL
jgi:hypothetical protein